MGSNDKKRDESMSHLRNGFFTQKDEPVFEALGDIDELSSNIGLLIVLLIEEKIVDPSFLSWIQERLSELMSQLALLYGDKGSVKYDQLYVNRLETEINKIRKTVEPPSDFIFQVGSKSSAQAHIARAICRRAERRIVALRKLISVPDEMLSFLNRLSKYLFVFAFSLDKVLKKN